MRKILLLLVFCGAMVPGFCQHSYTFDLFKGEVFIIKKNSTQQVLIRESEKFYPGDKLVIGNNTSWVMLSNEKNESFNLQQKGEYSMSAVDAQVASLKNSPMKKYWSFIKKHFLPEANVKVGVGGGIDMTSNNIINFPPDSAVYLRGEKIKLTIAASSAKKVRLIVKNLSFKFVLDTILSLNNPLDISVFKQVIKATNFSIAATYELTGKPSDKTLSFINLSIDKNSPPKCLAALYNEYPGMKNDETDIALLVKAGVLYENRYFAAAERMKKKVLK